MPTYRAALFVWSAFACCGGTSSVWAVNPPPLSNKLLRFDVQQQKVDGRLLLWHPGSTLVLARDGQMIEFPGSKVKSWSEAFPTFRSLSPSELKAQLSKEFGSTFEVSGTGHYLVVHPKGQREKWSGRFEEMYRSFKHYFAVRGFAVPEPMFPLVAVVGRDRNEFQRLAQRVPFNVPNGMAGFYSGASNRVYLYDQAEGKGGAAWHETAATIIHEVTHQTAYNTGVHNRFGVQPRWLVEGLGTLFEAPGVWNSRDFRDQKHRLNLAQFRYFRKRLADRDPDLLYNLITSDKPFETHTADAYAEAWAVTFYINETQAQRYATLLKRVAARPDFSAYSGEDRLRDWSAVFGSDFRLFEAAFLQYMQKLHE